MNKTRLTIIFLLLLKIGFSQEITKQSISSSVGTFVNSQADISLSWDIGQSIAGTFFNNDLGIYLLSGYETPIHTTGIKPNHLMVHSTVNVFPNPVVNSLHIGFDKQNFGRSVKSVVYDISGKAILESVNEVTEELINLNLSSLNSGVYLISIIIDNKVVNKTIIKQ